MALVVGNRYSREDVQRELGIARPTTKGKWGTGYTEHLGAFYVFANIGIAGRTEHDYANEWDGDGLKWEAKGPTRRTDPQVIRLVSPGTPCHIFTREHDRDRFTYQGRAHATDVHSDEPVRLRWVFGGPAAAPSTTAPGASSPPSSAPTTGGSPRASRGSKSGLHGPYRPVSGSSAGPKAASTIARTLTVDPAKAERALAGHQATQDALAELAVALGYDVLRPTGDVDYDLAWRLDDDLAVAEIKTITVDNETHQMRSGIGQLLDYAAALEERGETVRRLVLAVEREPAQPEHWRRACARAGVILCWAPLFEGAPGR